MVSAPRALFPFALVALAGCAPPEPDPVTGLGPDGPGLFGDPVYQRAPLDSTGAGSIATDTEAELDRTGNDRPTPPPLAEEIDTNNPGLSDEQNFDAVTQRETIESDARRLKAQQQEYRQIAPEPLPRRGSGEGPNIVEYALDTDNAVGQQVYRRVSLFGGSPARNCANYASADQAQEAFLASGGPKRDRKGLDPDGDGFACGWDPSPFRNAVE